MAYRIRWDLRAYKELETIPNADALRILNSLAPLTEDPCAAGTPLEGAFKGKYRIRVGDCRVIYWVKDDEGTVFIIAVGHRKDVYR
jgi:mRNA interferase RelE/StbE